MKALRPAMGSETSIEDVAREYFEVKDEIKRLEARKDELHPILEARLRKAPKWKETIGGIPLYGRKGSRRNFNLGDAEEVIDGRTLRPFISVSKWFEIRRSRSSKAKAAA